MKVMAMMRHAVARALPDRRLGTGWLTLIALTVALRTIGAAQVPPAGRPLTAEQANAVRHPMSTRISPDGRWIAFVVRQADAEHNRYQEGVYVVAADGATPPRRVAGGRLPQVVGWTPDGHEILFLADAGSGRRLWRVAPAGGAARRVSAHVVGAGLTAQWDPGDLLEFRLAALSPDGRYVAFLVADTTAGVRAAAALAARPVVDTGQAIANLLYPTFAMVPTSTELWLHDLQTGYEVRLWGAPARSILDGLPPEFAWSPDGTHLGVVYRLGFGAAPTERFDRRPIVILDVPSGHVTSVAERTGITVHPRWSADGRALDVWSEGPVPADGAVGPLRDWRYALDTKVFAPMSAGPTTHTAFVAADPDSTAELARRLEARQPLKLHDCSLARAARVLACIGEAPLRPPEVVLQRLGAHGEPVGALRTLTALNAALATAQLGTVAELQWPLAEGLTGTAGLVYPVGYQPGQRYPLLVMLYNLYTGRDFLATTFFPNFAPQTFAGRGYAVLLMNVPQRFRPEHASFDQIRWAELGRSAASVDSGVRRVVALGLADSTRLGVMGWSYGNMVTDYLLWQWPGRFRAAAASESGLYNPASYWLDARTFAEDWYHAVFGGGPYSPAEANWKALATVYHAAEVRTPVLMEYRSENLAGRELYTTLRAHQVPAELVWYPHETHVLSQPANVLASMRRHLAWFDFWLRHAEEPDTAEPARYVRWRAMREAFGRMPGAGAPAPSAGTR